MSSWRRIAAATWSHPLDPQIYGDLEIDATALLSYLEALRRATGVRVTVTHVVGRALANALAAQPELNVRLVRGRFHPRESVDIYFVASVANGGGVSGVKIDHVDRRSLTEVATELARRVERIREGGEPTGGGRAVNALPFAVLRRAVRIAAWLATDRNRDLRRLGLPRQPFGSAMVTSVGMFGVQKAYGPLSPLFRVPVLALVSEITQKPVVIDGEVVVRPMLTVTATMDHRFLDGAHAAGLARGVRAYLESPGAFEPPFPLAKAAKGGST